MVEKLSIAEVRRRLPVGTNFTAEFIGKNRSIAKPENVLTKRVVTKQTASQMISAKEDGCTVWLAWANVVAEEHDDGSVVLSMTDDKKKPPEKFLKITIGCPHYLDNQGFCHKCGVLMDEGMARDSGYFVEGMVEGK